MLAVLMGQAQITKTVYGRLIALAAAAIVGGIAFVAAGPACLAGPFGDLSPLVREHWYERIKEGLAIWQQSPVTVVSYLLPSILGFAGLVWTAHGLKGRAEAENWQRLIFVALGSLILSALVLRATAVTHAYVVPGYVLAVLTIFRWSRGLSNAIVRVPATAATMIALPLSVSAASVGVMSLFAPEGETTMPTDCFTQAAAAKLRQLPPTTIFATLDISPGILVATQHKVIASGHHRNHEAIGRTLSAFLSSGVVAEKLVRETGASHVVVCRSLPEYDNYLYFSPEGFTADLDRNDPPVWLRADPVHSSGAMRVYRVVLSKPE
jgi:hypothetical protein